MQQYAFIHILGNWQGQLNCVDKIKSKKIKKKICG